MAELTKAQRRTLRKLRGYRVAARLQTGAILVVSPGRRKAVVIDTDGSEFSFSDYLADLEDEASASEPGETSQDDDQDPGSGNSPSLTLRGIAAALWALW